MRNEHSLPDHIRFSQGLGLWRATSRGVGVIVVVNILGYVELAVSAPRPGGAYTLVHESAGGGALPFFTGWALALSGVGLCGLLALLHVSSPVPSMYTGLGEIEETLPDLLQTDTPLARHHVTATLRQRHGVAADEILREALEGNYGLIVIGASGTAGRLREWLLGNVTRQVVERASCSVLVAKRDGGE